MYQEDALNGRENCVLILIDVFFTAFVKLVFSFFVFFPSLQVCRLLKSVESKISNVHLPVLFSLDGRGVRGRDGGTVCLEKPTTRPPSCHNSYCQKLEALEVPSEHKKYVSPAANFRFHPASAPESQPALRPTLQVFVTKWRCATASALSCHVRYHQLPPFKKFGPGWNLYETRKPLPVTYKDIYKLPTNCNHHNFLKSCD